MKASALLILLLFSSLALAQQQYYGTTAASVSLPLPADPMDGALLKIHQGDVITPDNIRSSIQALYDTGRYRTIEVDATAGPSGTQVSFMVTVQYYFSTFRLDPDNLLERPISSYFPLPFGKKFSKTPVERMIPDIVKLLEDAGYFNATITPEYSPDDRTHLMTVVLKTTAAPTRATIRSIHISGGQEIFPDNEILGALKVQMGADFNADKIDKGVSRIRRKYVDKGYLTAKVQVDRKDDPVTNTVDLNIEINPGKTTIVQISETGSAKSEISDAKLRTLVPIFEEGTVDSDLESEGKQNIVEYYQQQGYFDASATVDEKDAADQSVRVEYVVVKGEKHRVRSIQIDGNAFFTEADILKKIKTSEEKSASHGLFSPELLAADVRAIQAMYQNAGFRSTVVNAEHEESANHDIDITIKIQEGLRSALDEITFTGNQSYPEPQLWHESGIQSDQIYSAAIIDNARDALSAFYYSHGYSEARVETHVDDEPVYNTVNVRFDITEGPQYRIGLILVSGNTNTAEKVITRSIKLHYNDPYNPQAILEAQQKLYALGIFNRVDVVTTEQNLGPYKNVLIQVEEAKPILLTPGFGVSDIYGPRATIELSDINLFGLDRTISARIRGGQLEKQFQASYRDPRLLNHDLQGIASLSFDKTTHPDPLDPSGDPLYRSNAIDFSVQVVRKLSKTRTLSFSASIGTVYFRDISQNPNFNEFPTANGSVRIGRLGTSFIDDRRDSVSDPTRGTFLTSDFELADKHWGSQVDFASLFVQGSFFTPVRGGVLATSARIGWKQPYGGDTDLPISERFFAGGSTTLRGFKFDAAGPPGGGELLTIGNIEYRVPLKFLPISNFGGAVFYDTGNVFERASDFAPGQFTHTAGTGLRYKTPLGPIRVDVGFNLRPKPADRKYVVFFTLGHAF